MHNSTGEPPFFSQEILEFLRNLSELETKMDDCRVKDFCYTWTIDAFFGAIEVTSEFRSPKLFVSAADHITFCLTNRGSRTFELEVDKSEDLELALASCEVTSRSASFTEEINENALGWTVKWKATKEDPSGALKIVVHLFLRESLPRSDSTPNVSLLKLTKDTTSLLNSGKFADLKLVAGGQEFSVHKGILAARTPELVEMLELTHGSSRKEVNCIRPQVLKLLLRYIYTGTFDVVNNLDAPLGLSATLDALKMDSLKSKLYAYPNHTSATTRLVTASHGFVWPVKNFALLPSEQVVTSPIVHPDKHCELRLQLKKNPGEEEDEVQVSLSLASDSRRGDGCHLRFDIGLEDVFGDRVLVRSWDAEAEEWIPALTVRATDFEQLPDDTLYLYCRVTMRRAESELISTESSSSSLQECCSVVSDPHSLSEDLGQLRRSLRFSDLTISARGKKFSVHKAILAARSPKLLQAIEAAGSSYGPSALDIEPPVLEKLLDYIYSGNAVQSDCASATKLYLTAYKYDLSPLKVTCLSYIKSSITF